ncbi:MAG TPA: glycosyltransferase [Thermoanaerobaculia bacterium]|nr:glycosyltransferase [Thermoanaerobaculia bacterium]
MRVLFFTRSYPTREAPVVAPFTRDHFRAASLFADVAVLHAQKTRDPIPWKVEKEDEVVRVRFRRRPFPSALRGLRELPFRPDLVHGHFYDAATATLLIARRLGVPYVLTEHSTLARPATRLERLAFRNAGRVMPVSRMLQSALESSGLEARYEVVPNVVDLERFTLSPRPGRSRLIAVTRMTPVKGVPDLLAALRLLKSRDWHCDLIGGGERFAEYKALASQLAPELGARVTFHGELQRPEVAARLREADLFVLASRLETFSVATVEAMACGVPVVATACGGPEELVGPEAGTIVPPGDPAALAEAIDRALSSRFDSAAISRGVAGRFSAEAVGARLLEIYEATLAERV